MIASLWLTNLKCVCVVDCPRSQARKAVVGWFADTLLVNTHALASNPDPAKAASQTFLMNVSVALLGLATPIVTDDSKFSKVSGNQT